MKLTIIGTQSVCQSVHHALASQKNKKIEFHQIPIKHEEDYFNNTMMTYNNLWNIQTSDAICLFGTWGSDNKNRQWHPKTNKRRQAYINQVNKFFVDVANSYDTKVIVFETATMSRCRQALSGNKHWKDENPKYYRMGLNHWTYGPAKFCRPKSMNRLEKFIIDNSNYTDQLTEQFYHHKWKNNKDGKIVIMTGLENDPTSTMPGPEFVEKSVAEIRKHTDKEILIKPHPMSDYESKHHTMLNKHMSLKDLAPLLYCAVLDNSTSIFELTMLGIPCFTTSANFGYKLGNIDLSKINDIYYSDEDTMQKWWNEMCHTEFRENEFKDSMIFDYIQELVE